ncbi:MAG TPA: NTP transferase domain-containing protein, partial [Methanocorpusculum sp.]|nr:NTP transferase domain-containing protein [Methanocorpusculum sp.]
MLALIFAGGDGSRLRLGEKALVTVGGRAMLSRVADAFIAAGISPLVVTSHKTPYTRNYCRAQGLEFIDTAGIGYLDDLHEAVELCGDTGPLFTSATDIPYLTAPTITTVRDAYLASEKEACSTWIPLECCRRFNTSPRYCETINGV